MSKQNLFEFGHPIPFGDYKAIKALNGSSLVYDQFSLEHVRAAMQGQLGKEDTEATKFGSGLHHYVLEPDTFDEEFLIFEQCAAIKKNGERCTNKGNRVSKDDGKHYCGTKGHCPGEYEEPKAALDKEQKERIVAIAERMKEHKVVQMMRAAGGHEVTVETVIEGLKCKGRIDKLIPPLRRQGRQIRPAVIIDLKTITLNKGGATEWSIQKAVRKYQYWRKVAFYQQLVEAYYQWADAAVFLVMLESEEPHGIRAARIGPKYLECGRTANLMTMHMLKHAMEQNEWPGYPEEEMTVEAPQDIIDRWLDPQAEDEIERRSF